MYNKAQILKRYEQVIDIVKHKKKTDKFYRVFKILFKCANN